MDKSTQSDTIVFELSHKLHQKVDRLAKNSKRPVVQFLNEAVEEYVEAMEKASKFRVSHFQKGLKSPIVPKGEVDTLFTKLQKKYGQGGMEQTGNS